MKAVGDKIDKRKHFGKQAITSELLKLVLQEVVEADQLQVQKGMKQIQAFRSKILTTLLDRDVCFDISYTTI